MNEPVSERHWHWEFMAFDHAEADPSGAIHWAVMVSVIGYLCEADARIAAQDIIQRQHYRLSRVWECPACGYQGQVLQAYQKMVDKL